MSGLASPLNEEHLQQLENEVNAVIAKGLPVTPSFVEKEEHDPKKQLPEYCTTTVLRIVEIQGLDKNPCCGTHVQNVSQLQVYAALDSNDMQYAMHINPGMCSALNFYIQKLREVAFVFGFSLAIVSSMNLVLCKQTILISSCL